MLLEIIYIDTFNILHNLPSFCTIFAFAFMSATIGIASVGFYSEGVQIFAAVALSTFAIGLFCLYTWVRRTTRIYMESYWIRTGSRRRDTYDDDVDEYKPKDLTE